MVVVGLSANRFSIGDRVMAVVGSGPGNAFTWQKYLQVGDRVTATIEGLGVQEFFIAAEA